MTDILTLTGVVATAPRHSVTSGSVPVTNFRLASTQRRFDRGENKWVDGDTNWYSISAFRQLALNSATSIHKGDRVIVTGRLRIRDWQTPEKSGTSVEIDAEALGHDLTWGSANWARTSHPASPEQADSFPGMSPATGPAGTDAATSDPSSPVGSAADDSASDDDTVAFGHAPSADDSTPF